MSNTYGPFDNTIGSWLFTKFVLLFVLSVESWKLLFANFNLYSLFINIIVYKKVEFIIMANY